MTPDDIDIAQLKERLKGCHDSVQWKLISLIEWQQSHIEAAHAILDRVSPETPSRSASSLRDRIEKIVADTEASCE